MKTHTPCLMGGGGVLNRRFASFPCGLRLAVQKKKKLGAGKDARVRSSSTKIITKFLIVQINISLPPLTVALFSCLFCSARYRPSPYPFALPAGLAGVRVGRVANMRKRG